LPTSDAGQRSCGWQPWVVLFASLALTLTSCAREPPRVPVYATRGTVLFQKKPAPKAVVVLRPVSSGALKQLLPHGEVGSDGTFQIGTYDLTDGAPVGEYVVTITWPETKTDPAGEEVVGGDRLKGRYNDAAKGQWKVQIKEGSNELPPFLLD